MEVFAENFKSLNAYYFINPLIVAVVMTVMFLRVNKKGNWLFKITIDVFFNYFLIVFIDFLFEFLFPESNIGYIVSPFIYIFVSAFLHRDIDFLTRFVRAGIIASLTIFISPICFPIVKYIEIGLGNEFLMSWRPFTLIVHILFFSFATWLQLKFPLDKFKKLNIPSVLVIIIIVYVGYILDVVAVVTNTEATKSAFGFNFFLSIILFISINLVYVFIYLFNNQSEEKEQLIKENDSINNEIEMLKAYEMGYNQVKTIKHDIQNQFEMVNSMLKNGNYDQAINYFDSLRIMSAPQHQIIYCENSVINLALNIAKEKGKLINCNFDIKVAVPQKIEIEEAKLGSIINNLLNNSLEAVEFVDEDNRNININIVMNGNFLTIRIINPYKKGTIKKDYRGNYITTKKDKDNHGYGLKIVNRLCESCNGVFKITKEKGQFIVDCLLQCDKGE